MLSEKGRLSKGESLKIAMVGTKGVPAKWGGIEKYIEEIGKRLAARGHEVHVFGSRWFLRDFKEKEYLGMRIHPLITLHFQATDALTNAFLASVMIAFNTFDIIHLHAGASYYFIPFLNRLGKRTIITAHGLESGWNNPKYGKIAKLVAKKSFETGILCADTVTTIAEHVKIQIRQNYNVEAKVLYSGLNDVDLQPAEIIKHRYGLVDNSYFLFLGRIDPVKRIDWLLDLLPSMKRAEIFLVIAGGSQDPITEKYLQDLKNIASKNSRIIFTGPVFGREKAELLSNCLAFITPSGNEGLPITVLEALSYGKFCIASDIPAHKEVITQNINGYLFPCDNKKEFVKCMEFLSRQHVNFFKQRGMVAKERIENLFNWERTTEHLEEAYRELISKKW